MELLEPLRDGYEAPRRITNTGQCGSEIQCISHKDRTRVAHLSEAAAVKGEEDGRKKFHVRNTLTVLIE